MPASADIARPHHESCYVFAFSENRAEEHPTALPAVSKTPEPGLPQVATERCKTQRARTTRARGIIPISSSRALCRRGLGAGGAAATGPGMPLATSRHMKVGLRRRESKPADRAPARRRAARGSLPPRLAGRERQIDAVNLYAGGRRGHGESESTTLASPRPAREAQGVGFTVQRTVSRSGSTKKRSGRRTTPSRPLLPCG